MKMSEEIYVKIKYGNDNIFNKFQVKMNEEIC